jgi:hypothetical protein
VSRRKSHHTHEVGDAYAEGWTARQQWNVNAAKPPNPYRITVELANKAKQSGARQASQLREVTQWDQGWLDCEEDLTRNDLDNVTAFDFRHLPKEH